MVTVSSYLTFSPSFRLTEQLFSVALSLTFVAGCYPVCRPVLSGLSSLSVSKERQPADSVCKDTMIFLVYLSQIDNGSSVSKLRMLILNEFFNFPTFIKQPMQFIFQYPISNAVNKGYIFLFMTNSNI